jgi:large subunit ribosomal protein L21e
VDEMVTRTGSRRRKAKKKLTKEKREKGKLSLTRYFAKFSEGDNVVLKAEPSIHGGTYHVRFHGKQGTVKQKQGRCYAVSIMDGSKQKTLIVHPVHLKRSK